MKRKGLFFVWAASLLGLLGVQVAYATETDGYYVPDELNLYYTNNGGSFLNDTSKEGTTFFPVIALGFEATKFDYNVTVPFEADSILFSFKWKKANEYTSAAYAEVEVWNKTTNKRVYSDDAENFGSGYFDSIYVIPLNGLSKFEGEVKINVLGQQSVYSVTVNRGESNVSILKKLLVTATDTTDKDSDRRIDTLSLRSESGVAVGTGYQELNPGSYSDTARFDTDSLVLYFEKLDPVSTVTILKNNGDIVTPVLVDSENDPNRFCVSIDYDVRYAIKVTAQAKSSSYYYVTVYSPASAVPGGAVDTATTVYLKNLYLYEAVGVDTVLYTLTRKSDGKIGFKGDSLDYRVIAPRSGNLKVGWTLNVDSASKFEENGPYEVVNYSYEKKGKRHFEVRLLSHDVVSGKDTLLKSNGKELIYTIELNSNDAFLKDFRVSLDLAGEHPVAFTPVFHGDSLFYTSVEDVKLDVDSVFVSAFTRDAYAKVSALGDTLSWGDEEKPWKFRFEFEKDDWKEGTSKKVEVTVEAEDGSKKTYSVSVRKEWDLSLESVTFSAGGGGFTHKIEGDTLKKTREFNVLVPAGVAYDDILAETSEKNTSYYSVTKVLKHVDDSYSYIIKVNAIDGRDSRTYTFNLIPPSSDASLSFLSVTPGALSPAFDPGTLEYSVRVPYEQDFIHFIAEKKDEFATFTGDGKHSLAVGDSTFEIVVTAQDQETTLTYKVTVSRESGTSIASLSAQSIQVYADGQALHVITPAAEQIGIYSVGGKLLYSLDKPAGKVSLQGLPKGILVIKGSSGWVKKAVI